MEKRAEPFTYLLKRTWRFSEDRRYLIVLFVLGFVVANGLYLLSPLVLGTLLNEIQFNGVTEGNYLTLLGILGLFFLLHLGFWLFHGPSRITENINAFFVRKDYKEYLLREVLGLDLAWHSDRDSGDTIDKIDKGSKALFEFSGSIFLFVEIIVRALGTVVIVFFFNTFAAAVLLALILIAFVVLARFDNVLIRQFRTLNSFENRIMAKIFDGLSNITSVIILRIQQSVFADVSRSIMAPWETFRKNTFINEVKWFTGGTIFELSVLIPVALYLFVEMQSGGTVAVGTVSALYLYVRNTGDVFFTFAFHYEETLRRQADVMNAEELEPHFARQRLDRKSSRRFEKKLALEDLSFSYEDTDTNERRHIDGVDFTIKKGERVALVGESGSGKTTFLKLLHGLYPIEEGKVIVDGKRLRKKLHEIDLGTTLVPQEPELFSASIHENITLGVDAGEESVGEVVALAQFADVVAKLPNGLESKINEKGVNLSGGEKQRLALARALLFAKDKEVILLDESTSSVDPQNETRIYDNIFTHFKGTTILASIHKFNLLPKFDRIVLFAEGSIVADGTLTELKKHNNEFKELWKKYAR